MKRYKVEMFVWSDEDPDWVQAELEDFVHDMSDTRLDGEVAVWEVSS